MDRIFSICNSQLQCGCYDATDEWANTARDDERWELEKETEVSARKWKAQWSTYTHECMYACIDISGWTDFWAFVRTMSINVNRIKMVKYTLIHKIVTTRAAEVCSTRGKDFYL